MLSSRAVCGNPIQHILLTLNNRFEHSETKGALFNQFREGIIEYRLDERAYEIIERSLPKEPELQKAA